MDISLENSDKTQGLIKINLIRDDFQPAVDEKVKQYSKTANIKGFRPGKVPKGMIKQMYGTSIIVEEINKLLSEKLNAYLRESDTQFLGEPIPVEPTENINWDNQEAFEFAYEVGFAEPFDLKIDKKTKIEKYAINVDDQVINETIENLQRQFGEVENTEVSAENDILYGKVTAKDGSLEEMEVSIDTRDAEKSTAKKLSGLSLGDEVEIDPKKGFKHESVLKNQLRLSEEEFKKLKKLKFTLTAISHHQLAEVNQDFFDKAFGKDAVTDEASFREKVKEVVSKQYVSESDRFFDHQIREKLIDSSKINLPDEFLKKWLLRTNEEITEEILEKEYTSYAKELKWSLIRNLIVKSQDLKVEHEEVTNEAKELIKIQFAGSGLGDQMNDQLDTFANNYLQSENGENYMKVYNQVQNKKVLEHIKDEITIKEKTVSLDEFRKL